MRKKAIFRAAPDFIRGYIGEIGGNLEKDVMRKKFYTIKNFQMRCCKTFFGAWKFPKLGKSLVEDCRVRKYLQREEA